MQKNHWIRGALALVLLALLTTPAVARDGVITNGIDTWRTPADGSSFVDFADDPIPAGFFCQGSEPYTGRIAWQGRPIATQPPGLLGEADTIVQRLDDAKFNRRGIAKTRVQVRALSLASIAPTQTSCGSFNVTASLHGEQPVTQMTIVREGLGSGHFTTLLGLNVRLRFTPADTLTGQTLELDRSIELLSDSILWSSEPQPNLGGQIGGFVLVDTDGDDVTDTFLPGQSAFYPAPSDAPSRIGTCIGPRGSYCHTFDSITCHCTWP